MKLVHQYMAIFFTFPPTLNHHHPLQVENCGSNLWLVMDGDDSGKFWFQMVNKSQHIKMSLVSEFNGDSYSLYTATLYPADHYCCLKYVLLVDQRLLLGMKYVSKHQDLVCSQIKQI